MFITVAILVRKIRKIKRLIFNYKNHTPDITITMDDSGCQQQTKEPDDKENDRSSSTRKKISNNSNRSCQKKSKAAGGKSVDKNTAVLSTTTEQRKNVLELGLPMDNMNLGSSSQKQSMVQQDSVGILSEFSLKLS